MNKETYSKNYFKGKRITVMGLGLLGRGVGDVKFLAEDGADLIVTDMKTKEQLQTSIDQLKDFPNITFVLGEHRLEDFRDRDMILKGAGVPLQNIYIDEAVKNNIPVEMSTALFCSLSPAIHIGITGTRGKSTTTQFVYEGLIGAGKTAYLGGNVRGVSTLAMLPLVKEGDYMVLELDSWQLQGFGTQKYSPHVAIFTTIFKDHMNYYHDDMDLYIGDKANIFLNQKENDVFVLGNQAKDEIKKRYPKEVDRAQVVDVLPNVEGWNLKLPGRHNRYNASLAYTALRSLHISEDSIKESFEAMEPVEGRLEFVRAFKEVKIYNDNNATTPDATMVALDALAKNKNVILIMGGADKGLDMFSLVEKIKETVYTLILIPGTGTEALQKKYDFTHMGIDCVKVLDVKNAVEESVAIARKGDVILFSPAFASFGQFNNEYERNDMFKDCVKKLLD